MKTDDGGYLLSLNMIEGDEVLSWTWYDIRVLSKQVTEAVFFQRAWGEATPIDETNMRYAAHMGPKDYFALGAIRVREFPDTPPSGVHALGALCLSFLGKTYHEDAPLGEYMTREGVKIPRALLLQPYCMFKVQVFFASNFLSRDVRLGIYLDGALKRRA